MKRELFELLKESSKTYGNPSIDVFLYSLTLAEQQILVPAVVFDLDIVPVAGA